MSYNKSDIERRDSMYFNLSKETLKQLDAYETAREINHQPSTWRKTKQQYDANQEKYQAFIKDYINNPLANIVFSGAGSSEFVGNTLMGNLKTKVKANLQSIPTTDLLTDVAACLDKDAPTIMVSFGRSGNSPESIGAFLEVENHCTDIKHIFITCNANGKLADLANHHDNILSIELTPETHDIGFAMTSSFTNMYLMALLLLDPSITSNDVETLSLAVEAFLNEGYQVLKQQMDQFDFERIVYLGSHTHKGIAQESALKLLELTGGETASLFNTFLGFRHGPKSFLNAKTLSVMYLSTKPEVRRYEIDLITEMSQEENKGQILIVDTLKNASDYDFDHLKVIYQEAKSLHDNLVTLAYVSLAQTLSLFKSLALDRTPDNPDPSGSVNRVVKGVTLYGHGGQS